MRLRDRYTLALIGLSTVIAVLVGGAILYQTGKHTLKLQDSSAQVMRNALYTQLDKQGRGMAAYLASSLTNPLYNMDMVAIYDLSRSARKQEGVSYAYVVDPSGEIIHDGTKTLVGYGRKVDDPATQAALTSKNISSHRGEKVLIASAPILSGSTVIGAVTVGMGLVPVQRDIAALQASLERIGDQYWRNLLFTTLALTAALLVLAWLVSAGVARNFTYPISKLSQLTGRIAQRDFDFDPPFERSDEMGDLAKAFRGMAQEIKATTVSKDYLEDVLNHMLDPLMVFRRDGTLETANATARTLLGLEDQNDANDNGAHAPRAIDLIRIGEGGEQEFDFAKVIESGRLESVEGVLVKRDGTPVPALISSSVMGDVNGEAGRILVVGRDITEHKEIEKQLRQAQKMEAVGQLTGGVAHDFNNLLAVILGNVELLLEQQKAGSEKRLSAIERAARRGADLTSRLLAFSRRQALLPRVTELGELVEEMHTMLSRTLGENIKIRLVRHSDAPLVSLDQGQLESAILNLVINARDAMPNGGQITIETRPEVLDDEELAAQLDLRPGLYACLAVSDTGEGIPSCDLPQVFEPFFTTKEAGLGSGLGLSMVYGFTKQSDGGVEIQTIPGLGTTVRLLFPSIGGNLAKCETDHDAPVYQGRGETILLVEDDADVREFARVAISRLGYRVIVAENASRALSAANSLERADLVLTDLVLTGGMNGAQLAREALKRKPSLKVVFMSGYPDDVLPVDLLSLQSADFLAKPFTAQELSAALHAALAYSCPQTEH